MAPKLSTLSEDASDDGNNSWRRHDSQRDRGIESTKNEDSYKSREKRRMHRSATGKSTTKMSSKSKSSSSSKRGSTLASSREASSGGLRHRQSISNRSTSSTSSMSDSEEDNNGKEVIEDHRAILAARARLTSPSLLSTITSLTTATNNSGGSSGSNSTVTQASMSRRSAPEAPTDEEMPISPAVPDPPDVFAFLEKDSPQSSDEEGEKRDYVPSNWPHPEPSLFARSSTQNVSPPPRQRSTSSSASSSFHSDGSELPEITGNETDRSTSPELSVKSGGEDDTPSRKSPTRLRDSSTHDSTNTLNPDPAMPTSPAAAKTAAQLLAAQQRQSLHNNLHQAHQRHPSYPHVYSTPDHQQVQSQQSFPPYAVQNSASAQFQHFTFAPPVPNSQLAAPPHLGRRIAKAKGKAREPEKPASKEVEQQRLSGYEALASALSNAQTSGGSLHVQPVYRKFANLNHRYLLYLQDELSELETTLRRIDAADASMRTSKLPQVDAATSNSEELQVLPSSRRAPRDKELEWHRSELVSHIGAKLGQYNAALTSFHNLEATVPAASQSSVSNYRALIATTAPVAEPETKFLECTADLVSIGGGKKKEKRREGVLPGSSVTAIAIAVAAAVLLPILTFTVIPGFLGRMVVALLVAGGVLGSLVQSGLVGAGAVVQREGCVVAGVYMGLMIVVAGVVG